MKWLKRITDALTAPPEPPARPLADARRAPQTPNRPARPRPTLTFTGGISADGPVALTGTTTFGRDAINSLLARRAATPPVMLDLDAVLQREPTNQVDPNAVIVVVEGERIGYLPSYLAKSLDLPVGAGVPVPVRLFAATQDGRTRAKAWAWLQTGLPAWPFDADNPPAITRDQERAAEHTGRRATVAEALAGGGTRAEQFQAGMVNGVHYLELVEPIKQLKRDGRLDEALELCMAAVTAAEGGRFEVPAPWYTEQAAIVLRKLGRIDDEIAVLERYLQHVPAKDRASHPFTQRAQKAAARRR